MPASADGASTRRGQAVALDIARGLAYLHQQQILHLDIKSACARPPAAAAASAATSCFQLTASSSLLSARPLDAQEHLADPRGQQGQDCRRRPGRAPVLPLVWPCWSLTLTECLPQLLSWRQRPTEVSCEWRSLGLLLLLARARAMAMLPADP